METIYIVIPIFNGEENIETLAENCKKMIATFQKQKKSIFVFVDDGSIDQTSAYIERYFNFSETVLLKHDKNKGPGRAFATAFQYLASRLTDSDWVLTMEGDNTSSHELVNKMFQRSEEGFDVILASPYIYGGTIINTSNIRKLLSFGANFILKEFLNLRGIFTMSSFFRLFRGSVIRRLQSIFGPKIIESKGFEGVVEMLMKMVSLEMTISEIPQILDTAKRKGNSKMRLVKTTIQFLLLTKHKHRWQGIAKNFRESENGIPSGNYEDALPRTL